MMVDEIGIVQIIGMSGQLYIHKPEAVMQYIKCSLGIRNYK